MPSGETLPSTVCFTTLTLRKLKTLLNLVSVTLKTKFSELLYVSKTTHLEPYETFKDDPLRVLRCFRFKARFDFDIHEDIYKALERQDIHESLRTKVSK